MKTSDYYMILATIFIQGALILISFEKYPLGLTDLFFGIFYMFCGLICWNSEKR
jgi:hypothetical protein